MTNHRRPAGAPLFFGRRSWNTGARGYGEKETR